MARFNEIVDLYWSESGDLALGDNGDLKDTRYENYRGFIQRVDTRMRSRKGDWLDGTIGAGLGKFVGQPMDLTVAQQIENLILNELQQGDLLRPGEFKVEVVPISERALAIMIVIEPPRSGGQVVLMYTYDLRDNRLVPRNI